MSSSGGDSLATEDYKVKLKKEKESTYQLLYDEWKALPSNGSDRVNWYRRLKQALQDESKDDFVDFFAWMKRRMGPSNEVGRTVTRSELFEYLEKANWKHPNEALKEATSRIASIYRNDYVILIGGLLGPSRKIWLRPSRKIWLAPDSHPLDNQSFDSATINLAPNSHTLHPQAADMATCEFHQITTINPQHFLLGVRYKPIKSPEEWKSFLFATIGKLQEHLPGKEWLDTGLVLILEVYDDGSPGDYFVIPNFTDVDRFGESFSLMIDNDFTLAKVPQHTQGLSIIEKALEGLSIQQPQIVETGTKEDWSEGSPPIPLYPPESSET